MSRLRHSIARQQTMELETERHLLTGMCDATNLDDLHSHQLDKIRSLDESSGILLKEIEPFIPNITEN